MLESLTQFVTVLLALSIASERLVELIKGIFPSLDGPRMDRDAERVRQLKVHWMSLLASVVIVYLTQDYIMDALKLSRQSHDSMLPLGVGLFVTFSILASGGSSMWNSILTYLLGLKNMKQLEVVDQRQQKSVADAKAGNVDLTKQLPDAMPIV